MNEETIASAEKIYYALTEKYAIIHDDSERGTFFETTPSRAEVVALISKTIGLR